MIVAIVALLALDVFAVAYGWSVRRAQKAHMTEPRTSLGAIVDTNSGGRFDLVVYEDGILAVKGTYWLLAGSARGNETYERTRLSKLLERPRSEVLADDSNNHFIPVETIVGLVLRKR